jgi:putative sterol carrier protein
MKFLSQEWFDAVNEKLAASDTLKAAAANASFAIQQVVSDGPEGDIHHYFRVDQGTVEMALGDTPDAAATMAADYATASALNEGTLDAMAAFSTGKMLVTGDISTLMLNQLVLAQMNAAFESVRDQTTY